jgi:hypothetical protein
MELPLLQQKSVARRKVQNLVLKRLKPALNRKIYIKAKLKLGFFLL